MIGRLFWVDRLARAAVGGIMVGLSLYGNEPILTWIGGILLATGVIGFCPVDALVHGILSDDSQSSEGRPAPQAHGRGRQAS